MEGGYYVAQMFRMGAGQEPDPGMSNAQAVMSYARTQLPSLHSLGKAFRRVVGRSN